MTNYHCADGCIKQLSTAEVDLQKTGFYAKTEADEKHCPEIEVNQLVEIRDVTATINTATKGLSDQAYNTAQKAEMSRIEKECTGGDAFRCDVVSLYHGGFYHLYKYRPYRDVRLVFAPEYESAFFGGDPDNFQFPRYNFDVAFLRAYENGKPVKTDQHFAWSAAGAKADDLVFVPGNPGGTDRLLTVSQLEYLRDVTYPRSLIRSSELRGVLTQFGKIGAEQRRISQDTLLFIENGIKSNRGEFAALTAPGFMESRARTEKELRARIEKDPFRSAKYGAAWAEVEKAQSAKRRMNKPYSMIETGQGFSGSLFRTARRIVRGTEELTKPNGERLREYRDSALPSLKQSLFSKAPIYREMEEVNLTFSLTKLREELGPDDPFVKKVLGKDSPEDLAKSLLAGTKLDDIETRKKLWDGGESAVKASADSMIRLALLIDADGRAIRKQFEDEVEAPEKRNSELIAQALFGEHGTSVYPDATFTPRLTFGAVKGWSESGRMINPFTDFAGLFARATGREPYVLPKSWLDAQSRIHAATPFNFVSTCDIIGGNSGSPVVGRDGNIVGLVFDGNIHSLGGNFWFDENLNRAVAVHSKGILEALWTVYGAERVVKELRPGDNPQGS